jgi:uncharacterized membrane protein YGL010W
VGPISVARLRGVGVREPRAAALGVVKKCERMAARARHALPLAAAAVLIWLALVVANPQARHWLAEASATLCVLGGFLAAPVLTVAAWIGLALPERMPLHQASTPLFLIAVIWMALALIGAHLHQERHPAPDE